MNYNKASPPKRHLNFYIHTILNYLRERREPVSFLEIKEDLNINLIINPSLIQSLKKNPRVEVSANSLKFKPLYDLRKKADLEALLTNAKEGIEYVDLVDSNPNIDEWIKMLRERILVLKDADESQVLFWNSLLVEKAPSEVLELFHSVRVPNYTDLVSELKNAGLKVQKNEVSKKRPMIKVPSKKYKRKDITSHVLNRYFEYTIFHIGMCSAETLCVGETDDCPAVLIFNFGSPFQDMQEQSSLVEVFVRQCSLNPMNILYGTLVPRVFGLSALKINYLSALKITLALVEYLKDSSNLGGESLGDVVGIYSVNRYECMIAEYAVYILRRKSCVLYTKEKNENIKHIMKETKMKTCFMSAECATFFVERKLFDDDGSLKNVILFDDLNRESVRNEFEKRKINLHRFGEIKDQDTGFAKLPSVKNALKSKSEVKKGRDSDEIYKDAIEYIGSLDLTLPERNDVATICYTSGTTGLPKGAMLTHSNFLALIDSFDSDEELIQPKETDVYFSYLPMAHVFERAVTALLVSRGSSIWFGRGKRELFAADMKKIRPTVLVAVPKVLQRITENVHWKIQNSRVLRFLYNKYPGAVMRLIRKVKLGTEGLRVCVSGSAHLNPDLCRSVQEILGCPVLQGYGMTETTAGVFIRAVDCEIVDTVGKPLKNVEVKLSRPERGDFDECFEGKEILVRGGIVFKGYYENEEATRAAFDKDGWFRTGDIASVDEQGLYKIQDRNSNIVKLSNGEFVQLEKLEALFALEGANDIFVFKAQDESGIYVALFSEDFNLSKKLEEKVKMLREDGKIQFCERPKRILVVSEKMLGESIESFWTPTGKKRRRALLEKLRSLGLVEPMITNL